MGLRAEEGVLPGLQWQREVGMGGREGLGSGASGLGLHSSSADLLKEPASLSLCVSLCKRGTGIVTLLLSSGPEIRQVKVSITQMVAITVSTNITFLNELNRTCVSIMIAVVA